MDDLLERCLSRNFCRELGAKSFQNAASRKEAAADMQKHESNNHRTFSHIIVTINHVTNMPIRRAAVRKKLTKTISTVISMYGDRTFTKTEAGVKTMAVYRCDNNCKPESHEYCRPNKSIDIAGNGRPGLITEGTISTLLSDQTSI